MQELLNAALEGVNLPYTILLGLVVLYWLSVILGALDLSALDFDLDADVDVDADLDMDTDVGGGMTGWFAGALHFFNFGKVPFMLIMTIVIVTAWSLALIGNHYLGNYSIGYALATALPLLFLGLVLAKLLTTPLVPLFAQVQAEAEPVDYVGELCRLVLPAAYDRMGQAEVVIGDNTLLIYVKTAAPGIALPTGAQALVVRAAADGSYFLIQPLS
jgi:hypothetical protein